MTTKQIRVDCEVLGQIAQQYSGSWSNKLRCMLKDMGSNHVSTPGNISSQHMSTPLPQPSNHVSTTPAIDYDRIEQLIKKHKADSEDIASSVVHQLRRGGM
jgi:hypothetical protein